MPKRNGHVPSYRPHKPSGLARVIVNGEHVYLGQYGSAESREKYARLIAEMSANRDSPSAAPTSGNGQPAISINEMLLAYWQSAETYYCKDGEPTKQLQCMKEAMWPLSQLYGSTKAVDFGPQALKAVRQHMIGEQGLCRNVANRRIGRIKQVFKWAVAEELVPPSTHHGLQALAGLRFGRTEARESEPVKPVDDKHVEAGLPFVTPHVSAMIQVQRLTGMRPDDVVSMRPCDIDGFPSPSHRILAILAGCESLVHERPVITDGCEPIRAGARGAGSTRAAFRAGMTGRGDRVFRPSNLPVAWLS